jgi:hypothetical protein
VIGTAAPVCAVSSALAMVVENGAAQRVPDLDEEISCPVLRLAPSERLAMTCGGIRDGWAMQGSSGPAETDWRSGPESNRHPRICSPMHHHSATGPPVQLRPPKPEGPRHFAA